MLRISPKARRASERENMPGFCRTLEMQRCERGCPERSASTSASRRAVRRAAPAASTTARRRFRYREATALQSFVSCSRIVRGAMSHSRQMSESERASSAGRAISFFKFSRITDQSCCRDLRRVESWISIWWTRVRPRHFGVSSNSAR